MDRSKIVAAILNHAANNADQSADLRETLKRLGDMNLLALAIDLGIDTDAILAPGLKEAQAVEVQLVAKNAEVRS